jgi:hypothetical protein
MQSLPLIHFVRGNPDRAQQARGPPAPEDSGLQSLYRLHMDTSTS